MEEKISKDPPSGHKPAVLQDQDDNPYEKYEHIVKHPEQFSLRERMAAHGFLEVY